MNELWQFVLPAITGIGLGVFFYGGLYFTIIRGLNSQHPALWFLSSFLLRTGLVVTGFYFISDGHWQRLLVCLTGFMLTGMAVRLLKRERLHAS